MADEMDKSDSFFEKLSKEENYKPPRQSPKQPAFELKHPGKQSLFFKLFKLDNFYELVKGQVMKIELPEIVKSLATILSEMRRAKNCGENAKEIVNLWQSVKQNDEFKKYFGNKSEGKNRRLKRRTYGHGPYSQEYILICVGVIVLLCIFLLASIDLYIERKNALYVA
uniref:Uncharacterized protein n=1 Tax=Globodera rostochiensis TaxID=31243 RepID=A0A914H5T0_GLORO